MTRMNILVAVLCLIMGRPYQFYYFVPLVSFWFVVIYAVIAVWPRVTAALVKGEMLHLVTRCPLASRFIIFWLLLTSFGRCQHVDLVFFAAVIRLVTQEEKGCVTTFNCCEGDCKLRLQQIVREKRWRPGAGESRKYRHRCTPLQTEWKIPFSRRLVKFFWKCRRTGGRDDSRIFSESFFYYFLQKTTCITL